VYPKPTLYEKQHCLWILWISRGSDILMMLVLGTLAQLLVADKRLLAQGLGGVFFFPFSL
jgi:hypothetical protein